MGVFMSMKCSKILILSLLFIIAIPMIQAQSDLNGTLKRNNFTSPKWNATSYNIIFNTTTNRIYLDSYNITGGLYENFTLFTEYEESLDFITVYNATTVRAKTDLFYGRYLGYDYDLDYFSDFVIRFKLKINGIGNTGLNDHYYFSLNNQTWGDRSDFGTGDNYYSLRIRNDNSGDDWNIAIESLCNGESLPSGWFQDNTLDNDWLYIQIKKLGSQINTTVYDNSDFTGLHWSYNLTHSDIPRYRYLYPVQSLDLNLYPNYWVDVWVKELDINRPNTVYFSSGEYYTPNLLENETGKIAYSLLYEGDQGAAYPIEIWFSEDNSTWITLDEKGKLIESYNYSSLYLRFRLNSSNGIDTPYLSYYHLFYKDSTYIPDEENGLTFGNIYWFILAIWIVLNVLGRMKANSGNQKLLLIMASVMGLIEGIMLLSIGEHIFAFLFFILNVIMLLEAASRK